MNQFHRKLLRDWKRISHDKHSRYYIRPQESNFNIWNIVLQDEKRDLELYCMVLISHDQINDTEPIVLLNCLTPNPCIPMNKTLVFNTLSHIIVNYGLVAFYEELSSAIFRRGDGIPHCTRRLSLAWNRLLVHEFKYFFPNLYSEFNVSPSDVILVNDYLQAQTNSSKNGPVIHGGNSSTLSKEVFFSSENCSEQFQVSKRQRTGHSSSVSTSPLAEPENNLVADNYEDCDFLESRKRRR